MEFTLHKTMASTNAVRQVARLLDNRAQVLFHEGRFEEAIEAAGAGITSARCQYKEKDADSLRHLLDAILVAADIERQTGLRDAGESLYLEALKLAWADQVVQPQIAFVEAGLGSLHEERGENEEAARYYESAVKALDAVAHPAPEVAEECGSLRNNLAMIYKEKGDYQAAEAHLVSAIERMESVCGRDHPTTATLYGNLSALYCTVDHYEKAREMATLARDIRHRILPANHPEYAQSLYSLGAIHYALDNHDAAVGCYEMALEAMDSNEEIDPEEYQTVLANYIGLLRQRGEEEKAEQILQQALDRASGNQNAE